MLNWNEFVEIVNRLNEGRILAICGMMFMLLGVFNLLTRPEARSHAFTSVLVFFGGSYVFGGALIDRRLMLTAEARSLLEILVLACTALWIEAMVRSNREDRVYAKQSLPRS